MIRITPRFLLLTILSVSASTVYLAATPTPVPTSPSGTTIPSATQIIDASGNVWTVVSGVVQENGANAGFSQKVIELAWFGGVIYQENSSNLWWSWNGSTWISTGNPTPSTLITIGDTTIETSVDYGNGNLVAMQSANLNQSATIQSLSFYVGSPGGNLVLGIYADNAGVPGLLVAQTAAFTPAAGWNTASTTSNPTLAAGNYWLAYSPSSSTFAFRITSGGQYLVEPFTYTGSLPSSFTSTSGNAFHWSFYATLTPTGTPPTGKPGLTSTLTPTGTPPTGKPGLRLFGGAQGWQSTAHYTVPDPLWKPIADGVATGNQFPANWYRDDFTMGYAPGWDNWSSVMASQWSTVRSYCDAHGINGPCVQLHYAGAAQPTGVNLITRYEAYLTAIAPYCKAGTYEIACNEITGGSSEVTDGLINALAADTSIGGPYGTGWDGLINLVKLQRQYLPGVLLGLNEYDVCDLSTGGSPAQYYHATSCIAAYKACHDNGAALDWLGTEGYWGNFTMGPSGQPESLAAQKAQIDSVSTSILPYLTGACGTACLAFTEFTPMGYNCSGRTDILADTLKDCWTLYLNMFANDPYIFGVTGPWASFRKSAIFQGGDVNWFYDDTASGDRNPDCTSSEITPALTWLQGWVPGNVHN
jgi:hypothetical protein